MDRQRFSEALLNAVDFAFHSLGQSCQRALYFHLEKTFRIERSEIPDKVEEFGNALRLVFKDGAVFLERLILKKLWGEMGFKFEEKHGFDFVEDVSKVRRMALGKESLVMVPVFREEVTVVQSKRGGGKLE